MGVGGQRHAPAALTPGKRPSTHYIGDCVGYRAVLDGYGISSPPQGFDLRTVKSVVQSLYRLSYPGPKY